MWTDGGGASESKLSADLLCMPHLRHCHRIVLPCLAQCTPEHTPRNPSSQLHKPCFISFASDTAT